MTLMCIDRSQSPTHKGSFLQGGKSAVSNNLNHHHNANHHRRNSSCSPPLSKSHCNSNNDNNNQQRQQQQQQNDALSPPAKSSLSNNPDSRKLERSSSEPARAVQSNSSRYKTELCRPFEENGICKYGDKCQFAHGSKELRSMARHPKYKTELCRTFHSTGLCPYGPRCHFIHNSEQTKKTLMTTLTGSASTSPRPKALSSLGSAGDVSPVSSHGSSPTESKSFSDLYQQNPLSPVGYNNVFFPADNNAMNNFQQHRYVDYPVYEYKSDIYDSINVFNEKLVSESSVDNYSYQSGPVLDLFPADPMTPTTPLDANLSFFRLPIFDAFQKQ